MSVPVVLFACFTVCLLIGIPISFSVGIACLAALYVSDAPMTMLAQVAFSGNDGFAYLAVPMFILAGILMERGGLSPKIIRMATTLIGPRTGSLAIVTIAGCMFFGAMCGSGPATVAAMGAIMIPAMVRDGYSRPFAGAVSACGGGLGVLIPPSIPLIVYGITVNASITDLFLASIVPGALVALAMMITVYLISRKNGWKGDPDTEHGLRPFLASLKDGVWAILAPVIILGGIYGGVFTPTEAGGVAVVYSIIVAMFLYRAIKVSQLCDIIVDAAVISAVVMIILGLSVAFGRIMTQYRIPQLIASAILDYSTNKIVILLLMDGLLLFLGTFMETGPIIIIFGPLLLPLCQSIGLDAIYLGVLICLATEIGFMTPPLGQNLFVAQKIGNLSLGEIFKPCIPLLLAQTAVLVLLNVFPALGTLFVR